LSNHENVERRLREKIMLIDTHCHLNILAKDRFDVPLTQEDFIQAEFINNQAIHAHVSTLINVGTSLVESENCVELARRFDNNYAVVGIHPNDLTDSWAQEIAQIESWLKMKDEKKIVGIGETGLDFHYPKFNLQRQKDAFKAQIELALEYNLALVVHSRDAAEETLGALEEYMHDIKRGVIHCFSYDYEIAQTVIEWGFVIGIDGPITYPKNMQLRDVVNRVPLDRIVLETDAPFLPPQAFRGKKNHPQYLPLIAQCIAEIKGMRYDQVAEITTATAKQLFLLP
jgi:TatD DNase family protein